MGQRGSPPAAARAAASNVLVQTRQRSSALPCPFTLTVSCCCSVIGPVYLPLLAILSIHRSSRQIHPGCLAKKYARAFSNQPAQACWGSSTNKESARLRPAQCLWRKCHRLPNVVNKLLVFIRRTQLHRSVQNTEPLLDLPRKLALDRGHTTATAGCASSPGRPDGRGEICRFCNR